MLGVLARRTMMRQSVRGARPFSSIETKYTASATATGGRAEGTGKAGSLQVTFGMPKELGGKGDPKDTNPEQLFSLGYSACFVQAMNVCYRNTFPDKKPLPKETNLKVKTSIGKPTDGEGFKLAVEISLLYSSVQSVLSKDEANKLLQDADQTCPYSRATRGNIEHELKLTE